MEVENIEAALTQAGEFLEREPPFNRHEKDAYSKAARAAFGYVKKARADGFSFVQICAALVKAGLLPREAHPHSLRQAFYRECRKEKRNNELSKRILSGTETATKAPVLPVKPEQKGTEPNPPVISSPRVMHIPNRTAGSRAGLEVKPDNTFTIRPIDPDDLPDT